MFENENTTVKFSHGGGEVERERAESPGEKRGNAGAGKPGGEGENFAGGGVEGRR